MLTRFVATLRLLALVALEVATIPLLRGGGGAGAPDSIDWAHLGRWVDVTAPEDAVTAVVRLVGLALAIWLLASTVLYVAASVSRVGVLVQGVRWATLPVVRKVVDGAVAASVLGSAVLSAHPAGAQAPPPAPIVVELGATTTTAPLRYVPVPAGDAAPAPTTTRPPPSTVAPTTSTSTAPRPAPPANSAQVAPAAALTGAGAPAPARAQASTRVHTVVRGDNLWTIAEADLARQTGRRVEDLTVAEIASHWVKVVAANRGTAASGDPNLIFPGENIVCPPAG